MSTAAPSYAALRSRSQRMIAPLTTAGLVSGTTMALRFRDPHVQGSWGLCPFKALTGWDCPGCGSLRAVNDLTHGDVVAAASSNLVLVLAIPLVVGVWALWVHRTWTGESRRPARPRTAAVLALGTLLLAVAFTVVRNTSGGAWLHS